MSDEALKASSQCAPRTPPPSGPWHCSYPRQEEANCDKIKKTHVTDSLCLTEPWRAPGPPLDPTAHSLVKPWVSKTPGVSSASPGLCIQSPALV